MEIKRPIPNEEKKAKRLLYMKDMEALEAIEPKDTVLPRGLEQGNSKTGNCGKKYDKVFVWNLPPVITCPGLSEWCKTNCYNADDRYDKFPIDKWCENLWWVLNDPLLLQKRIISQLSSYKERRIAVRIHSSGDFFTKEYISFWRDIIQRNLDVRFWAYTRSWAEESLLDDILKLTELGNISLILSWDITMRQPLNGYAKSIVFDSKEEMILAQKKQNALICPEQLDIVPGCADCGICINKPSNDIYFILH